MSVMITTGAPPMTVAYEAERLDRLFPGWHERVDTEELHLPSMRSCVLGQAEGHFRTAWMSVFKDALGNENMNPIEFYCEPLYETEWIEEIERRRR